MSEKWEFGKNCSKRQDEVISKGDAPVRAMARWATARFDALAPIAHEMNGKPAPDERNPTPFEVLALALDESAMVRLDGSIGYVWDGGERPAVEIHLEGNNGRAFVWESTLDEVEKMPAGIFAVGVFRGAELIFEHTIVPQPAVSSLIERTKAIIAQGKGGRLRAKPHEVPRKKVGALR